LVFISALTDCRRLNSQILFYVPYSMLLHYARQSTTADVVPGANWRATLNKSPMACIFICQIMW